MTFFDRLDLSNTVLKPENFSGVAFNRVNFEKDTLVDISLKKLSVFPKTRTSQEMVMQM